MNEHFEKSVNNCIEKLEELVKNLVRLLTNEGQNTPNRYKQTSVATKLLFMESQKVVIGHMVRGKMFKGIKFLDNSVLFSQSTKIFKECLTETRIIDIDEHPDQHGLEKAFISCV
jgi:hypothetical protein